VEASAVQHPAGLGRLPIPTPLLRLRSDDQLLAHFRAGNDDAFDVLHDRYRQRLFAYVRQMLSAGSRQDAEDVMQDVFVRAYGALRADARAMNVRAWLYRVAHNRCIDHLRRPVPPAAEVFEVSRKPLQDPVEEAQRREDLARLVQDIGRLPDQQRSALLMRELDGMSYANLAVALDVTVPAVKSLLVRARVGLVDASEARDADCGEIRADLIQAHDRGVKASGRARRHMRTCGACTEYRTALRGLRSSFAALTPIGLGPLALGAKLLGLGGAGGGAAAGGTAAAGSGAMAAGGGIATVTACKVAAVVCTAAMAGGAVEARHMVREHQVPAAHVAAAAPAPARVQPRAASAIAHRPSLMHGATVAGDPATAPSPAGDPAADATAPGAALDAAAPAPVDAAPATPATTEHAGGAVAPDDGATTADPAPATGETAGPTGDAAPGEDPAAPASGAPAGGTAPSPATPGDGAPPATTAAAGMTAPPATRPAAGRVH
jgi:RNA polymerase sigma factor (sigma-70 family)